MQIGPVQLLVIGYPTGEPDEEVRQEIGRLRSAPGIRLLDLLHVCKHEDGRVERIEVSGLSEAESAQLGALAGALIGFATDGEDGFERGALAGGVTAEDTSFAGQYIWYPDDAIPPGSAATLVLIEHCWAIGMREQLISAGGFLLADAWIHPSDLVAIGLMASEDAQRELSI
jgi:uncharacterized membrane protein